MYDLTICARRRYGRETYTVSLYAIERHCGHTKSPTSHLEKACPYPHFGECTLPLRVLAVACTMRNEALRSVTGRYGTLRNRYGKYLLCPPLSEF